MHIRLSILTTLFTHILFTACKKDDPTPPATATHYLIFKFKFDSTQERLNSIGQPATIPAGNAAQSPVFNGMSAHYIEMTENEFTALGAGDVLYHAPETTDGGSTAIDFDSSMAEYFFKYH